jgi:outer membrane lipoprotein SlyB
MSRAFWTVIGAIGGFFVGGMASVGLARALFSCCYGETMYPAAGSIIGAVGGAAIARYFARPRSS